MSRINTFHMWADMKSSINVVEEIFFIIQISLFCVKRRRQALVTSCHLSFRIYMEQDMLSLSSIGDHMKITHEASDSSSSIHSDSAVKRVKVDHTVASTKFKGVVKQSNGNWGAQIYANHERIWLGTFKSEKEAAMAYDRAGMKLRSGDFQRNFPWTEATTSVQEQKFQIQFTTEQVLSMIKDGTYQAKFDEFLSTKSQNVDKEFDVCQGLIFRKQLFRKALTPSDVGKLNRLVIPKKYALKYFQCLPESVEDNSDGDIEEEFFDNEMNLWKFRYCYWKSSQSFVFTKGWNRFVKEKKLKANDTIIFYACQYLKEAKATKKFTMIRVNRGEENAKLLEEDPKQCHDDEMSLKLRLEVSNTINNDDKLGDKKMEAATTSNSFKLFGVQIIVPQQREMNLDLNLL